MFEKVLREVGILLLDRIGCMNTASKIMPHERFNFFTACMAFPQIEHWVSAYPPTPRGSIEYTATQYIRCVLIYRTHSKPRYRVSTPPTSI